ncbi:unnamed protein product [Staurois parvus]|uniref:Uncharacterized protein n=1 Tax=Staurois parvus TaxID=386267 RepID=A0ABN9C8P2_9NEOB|nr:unnamed protein product [Staurois parvus]
MLLYISCPHQSAPLHQVSPPRCYLTSDIPIRVPLTLKVPLSIIFPRQSALLHHIPH